MRAVIAVTDAVMAADAATVVIAVSVEMVASVVRVRKETDRVVETVVSVSPGRDHRVHRVIDPIDRPGHRASVVRVRKETDHRDRSATARRVSVRRVNPVRRDKLVTVLKVIARRETALNDHHVHHASHNRRHRLRLSRLPL